MIRQIQISLFALFLGVLLCPVVSRAATGDTVTVQTLTYDSLGRAGFYQFPDNDGTSYERVILQYRLRCIKGKKRVSRTDTVGCGEWDYNCETYIIDSSRTDSVKTDTGYIKLPQKFELMSFVTPYGIGLDLGANGTLWEFDVTDYLPILRGWKGLSVERGSHQEEMDLRFLFIKGTPARKPIDIQQVWPMTEENYQTIMADNRYEPRVITFDPQATSYKLRAMITGHGQEGEFITRQHFVKIGDKRFQWEVFKNCSGNPLYPQGGTWVYRRAGWCPGAPTELKEYELSNAPGSHDTIDYGVTTASGDSRYDPSIQIVSYAAPSFQTDAAIAAVERPSSREEYARINPSCDQPIVVLQNNGATPLTSATIRYHVDGGPTLSYDWTGSLKFLDTLSVALPVDDVSFWGDNTKGTFYAEVVKDGDEYANDNLYMSQYERAPYYQGTVVVNFRTNKVPEQNYYQVYDHDGKVVFSNDIFDPAITYNDSLMLPVGCYTFKMFDDGENGISWWATPDDGDGYLRLRQDKSTGKILHTFNPDFGAFTQWDFAVTQSPLSVMQSARVKRVRYYPNPTKHTLNIELEGYAPQMIAMQIFDAAGRPVTGEQRFVDPSGHLSTTIDISQLPKGAYRLRLTSNDGTSSEGFVVE